MRKLYFSGYILALAKRQNSQKNGSNRQQIATSLWPIRSLVAADANVWQISIFINTEGDNIMKQKLTDRSFENLSASITIDCDGMATVTIYSPLGLNDGDVIPLKRGGNITIEFPTSPLVDLMNGHAII